MPASASAPSLCDIHAARISSRKRPTGWKRRFDDPIVLPRGRQLVTIEDAGAYITELPKADQQLEEWQTAIECLMLVVTVGGPTMFARIGMMRALNHRVHDQTPPGCT